MSYTWESVPTVNTSVNFEQDFRDVLDSWCYNNKHIGCRVDIDSYLKYVWYNGSEQSSQTGMANDELGLRDDEGIVYKYCSSPGVGWQYFYTIVKSTFNFDVEFCCNVIVRGDLCRDGVFSTGDISSTGNISGVCVNVSHDVFARDICPSRNVYGIDLCPSGNVYGVDLCPSGNVYSTDLCLSGGIYSTDGVFSGDVTVNDLFVCGDVYVDVTRSDVCVDAPVICGTVCIDTVNNFSNRLYLEYDVSPLSGISWKNSNVKSWSTYIGCAGQTDAGPTANITVPTGSLVNAYGYHNFIEENDGYGWVWEKGTCNGDPSIVMELRSCDGFLRVPYIYGIEIICSPIICGTSCVKGSFLHSTDTVCADCNVESPMVFGTTCVESPIMCSTTCLESPLVCGTDNVISPIVCGSTCVESPVVCPEIICNTNYRILQEDECVYFCTFSGEVVYEPIYCGGLSSTSSWTFCTEAGLSCTSLWTCCISSKDSSCHAYGNFYLQTSNGFGVSSNSIAACGNGNTELYFGGELRLLTRSDGVCIIGDLDVTDLNIHGSFVTSAVMCGMTCLESPYLYSTDIICSDSSIHTRTLFISNCVNTPLLFSTTCIETPIFCSSECIETPLICGTSCVNFPVICGTDSVQSQLLIGSFCINSPIICGTSCVKSPYLYSTGTAYIATSVNSPIICGSTCVNSPIVIGTTCLYTPVVTGSSCVNFPVICGSLCLESSCIYSTNTACIATSLDSPIVCGITCVDFPIVCGTSYVNSPIVCGTSCVKSPYLYSTGIACVTTSIHTPIVCAATCINTPVINVTCRANFSVIDTDVCISSPYIYSCGIACINYCVRSTVLCGTNCVMAPCICGILSVKTPYLYSTGTACVTCSITVPISCNTTCVQSPVFSFSHNGSFICHNLDNIYIRNICESKNIYLQTYDEFCANKHSIVIHGGSCVVLYNNGSQKLSTTDYGINVTNCIMSDVTCSTSCMYTPYICSSCIDAISHVCSPVFYGELCCPSSYTLKHDFCKVCFTDCIRSRPLNVYSYVYNDGDTIESLNRSFGVISENYHCTFPELDITGRSKGVKGLSSVAYGLAYENMQRIDKAKIIFEDLYNCISKLENELINLK